MATYRGIPQNVDFKSALENSLNKRTKKAINPNVDFKAVLEARYSTNGLSPVQSAAQQQLDYMNSREYAHKQETQRKQAQQRADDVWQQVQGYVSDPNVDPLSDPKILEFRNQYNAELANTKPNKSQEFMTRHELEILAAGGKPLMERILELSELGAKKRQYTNTRHFSKRAAPNNPYEEQYNASYNRLEKTYGKDALDKWLEYADRANNLEDESEALTKATQFGRDKADIVTWNASVGAGLAKPLGFLDVVGQHAENLITGNDYPIDYHTPAQRPGKIANAIRAGATEDKGKVGAFLYNNTASLADSLIPMVAAPGFGQYIVGMSSATDTINAAAERGATDGEALALGVIAGTMEMVTEKMDFDRVFGATSSGSLADDIIKVLADAGIEGTQEGITTLANVTADALISSRSEMQAMIEGYMDDGHSWNEAATLAQKDFLKNLGSDIVGGYFSSALASGIKIAGNAATGKYKKTNTQPTSNQTTEQEQPAAQPFPETTEQPTTQQSQLDTDLQNAFADMPTVEQRLEQAAQDLMGQKNTAPVNSGIDSFTEHEANNLTSHKGIVNGYGMTFREFIKNAKNLGNTVRFYFGKVSNSLGKQFSDSVGKDITGYNIAIRTDEVLHPQKEHGNAAKEAQKNQLPVTPEVVALIPDVLDNPDRIVKSNHPDYAGREAFEVKKQLENYVVVVVGIANGRHSIEIDSMYVIDKKGSPTTVNATQNVSLDPTSKTSNGQTLPNPSIPTPPQNVNGNIGDAEVNPAVGAANAGFSPYSHAQLQYGTIPPGENPARVVDVPVSMDGQSKVMQTVRTIMEADATPDVAIPELENAIVDGGFSRMPITDQSAAERAEATIRRDGYQQALADWMTDVRNGKVSKDSVVIGETLYNAAVNAGDMKSAVKIAIQLSAQTRSAAQALQAIRMLKKMSPAAQLYGVKQSVDNLQKKLMDKYGSRAPNLVINEDLAAKFLEAETAEAKKAAEEALYEDIAKQIPATFADKWNAWRYLSMLGNARTHIRNIAGNAMFAPVRFAKNKLGAAIEAGAQKVGIIDQSQRTKAFGSAGKELMDAARADYANVEQQIMSAGKYNSASDIINKNKTIFKSKALETLRKGNSNLLEIEDMWFSKSAYASSLASYLKAQGFTASDFTGNGMTQEQKDAARAYAIKEAQKATYRDVNAFSEFVNSIGFDAPGDNVFKRGINAVIEGTMPFKNTPANILARSVEYSPVGLLKTLAVDSFRIKNGKITATDYMDMLSSGLTGTMLFGLGCLLSNLGILRGGTPEDEEQYELEGRQPYSLEIGDTSITLDWLAPEAMPVFMGVELMEAIREGGGETAFTDKLVSFLNGLSGPMLEMSMMSSLQDALESTESADNKMMAFLANGALGYLKQALPTVFGQLERSIREPTRETTFLDKSAKVFGTDVQYAIASAANKIPLWDYSQIPYIDAWGRTEDMGGVGERFFNNMLNPAYVSRIEETPVDGEIKRLEKALGTNLTPSRAKNVITVNEKQEILTAKEYVTYAQAKGQNDLTFRQNLIDSDAYKGLDNQTKAKAMEKAAELANILAVKEAGFNPKMSGWQSDLVGADADTITNTLIQKAVESQLGTGSQRYDDISKMVYRNTIDDATALALLTDSQFEKYNEFCTYADVPVTTYLQILGYSHIDGKQRKQEEMKAQIERVTQDNKQRRALWCTLYSKNTIPGNWWN